MLRGAPLTACPMCRHAPRAALPCSFACHARPRREGRGGGGGCAAPGGEGNHPVSDPGPVPDTLNQEQQPLAAPVAAPQKALQHPAALEPAGWGGSPKPSPKPICSPLLLAIPGWRSATLCPIRLRRSNERRRDGAKNIRQARGPSSIHAPRPCRGACPWLEGGGGYCGRRRSQRGCPQPPPLRRHEARATEAVRLRLGL